MALVTNENKILRIGFKNPSGSYDYPITIGTGDATSTDSAIERSTRIKFLAEPAASHDAVPLGYLTNNHTSRLQPVQIGDSTQRTALQTSFATPLDSTDTSGGAGTFFFNTAAGMLEVWKDSQWQSLRSRFDSGEVSGIVSGLVESVADSAYVMDRIDAATLDFSNIPDSDPNVAGLLWNHNGSVNISAG